MGRSEGLTGWPEAKALTVSAKAMTQAARRELRREFLGRRSQRAHEDLRREGGGSRRRYNVGPWAVCEPTGAAQEAEAVRDEST